MKETLKLGITLLVITAVAAGVLAFSNSITEPIIAEREKQERFGALYNIFPDAEEFLEVDEAKLKEVQSTYPNITEIIEIVSGGSTIGYAFNGSAGGYGGPVNVLTGISVADNTYKGKTTTEKLVAVASPSADNEVQLISGATISSFAVLTAVNEANEAYLVYFTELDVEPPVEETEEEKEARFMSELFADADEFTPIDEGLLESIIAENIFVREIFEAKAGSEVIGYIFKTISGGYGGELPVMTGISLDGTITGIRVGANSETPGLGTKIEEPDFQDSFVGKATEEELVAVPSPAAENEVQLISGATVSTDGVLYGVNGAREAFLAIISQ